MAGMAPKGPMNPGDELDHETFREWLDQEVDGTLRPDLGPPLAEHLGACAACRAERQQLAALSDLLVRTSLPVAEGFRERVLAALPAAGWESRHPRAWGLPAVLCLVFGAVATYLFGTSSPRAGSVSSALLAVAGMLRAAVLAGAGLLAASFKGLQLVFAEGLSSPMSLLAFGVFVLGLNMLLVSLVRRRRPAAPGAAPRRSAR